jgi:hypothetical protein
VLPALLLTLAVEVPLYTAALVALRLARWWRAAALGVLVNLLTHPALWLFLVPHPAAARFWTAEALATIVEAAMLVSALAGRRQEPRNPWSPALLLVVSLGANACSLLMGLLLL